MPLPAAVVRPTAHVTRVIRASSLSVFLETRHCSRMAFETRGTSEARSVEGRRRPVPKKNETLEDSPNELLDSRTTMLKKQRLEGESSFLAKKLALQVPKPSSSANLLRERVLLPQTTHSHPPRTSSTHPIFLDDQTPNFEPDPYSEEPGVFNQAPSPPLPKCSPCLHPPVQGINGRAAAIAYLRIRGWANRGHKKTFYAVLAWILRYAARDLGFEIVPDGFVRISDLLRFELFERHTLESFAKACISDMFDRFEVVSLPDLVDGEMREVWWARARAFQTIPGVHASNKRIINMGKLQTVAYRAPLTDWPIIQKYGILEDPDRVIRLYQSGTPYFRNIIPRLSKHICITIDAQRAAELGVKFFHTMDVRLLAVGRNGAIPVETIRSVVELDVARQDLI